MTNPKRCLFEFELIVISIYNKFINIIYMMT